jgi:sterol 3beta-glucosyltransferase
MPHDWLFPQVAAVVHHGGAGTTGAALRAGRPMMICPFVGDQFFWGRRVKVLGVGPSPIPQARLTAERLTDGIRSVVGDQDMRQRAAALGKAIRAEDGIGRAIVFIHKQLSG